MAKPSALTALVDPDFSNRAMCLITIVTGVNAVLEYYYTNTTHDCSVPAQSTSDENLLVGGVVDHLNSCITALNGVITAASLGTTPGSTWISLDYNDIVPAMNVVITLNNAVLTALP